MTGFSGLFGARRLTRIKHPVFRAPAISAGGCEVSRGDIEQAEWRRSNAVRAVRDALVELRVADRLLREAKGFPAGGLHSAGRVASDPAGGSVPLPAGSAGPAADTLSVVAGPAERPVPLVWPPEWQR
jgi:hypothetical protein